jgi:hypothetical protein
MSLCFKDPNKLELININDAIDNIKLYRIVHLRDAYFLDNMYFKGRKAAEDYLHLHLCKIAGEFEALKYSPIHTFYPEKVEGMLDNNQKIHFEIVEA